MTRLDATRWVAERVVIERLRCLALVAIRRTVRTRASTGPNEEPNMSDKSPRQHMAKKQGKTIKEKRADKKANAAATGDPVARAAKR